MYLKKKMMNWSSWGSDSMFVFNDDIFSGYFPAIKVI